VTTTHDEAGAPTTSPPVPATRGRHALTKTATPRRLRAELALRPPEAETPVIVRRPIWSVAINRPVTVPSEFLRPRSIDLTAAPAVADAIEIVETTTETPALDLIETPMVAEIDIPDTAFIPRQREPAGEVIAEAARDHTYQDYSGGEDNDEFHEEFDDPGTAYAEASAVEVDQPPGGRHRQDRSRTTEGTRSARWQVASLAAVVALGVAATALIWRGDLLVRSPFGSVTTDAGDRVQAGGSTRERQAVTGTLQPIEDLVVGDCFQDLPAGPGPFSVAEVVRCAQPHDNQLVAVFELADREWPGDPIIAEEAQARCREIGGNVVEQNGADPELWDFWVLVPTRQGWVLSDDRLVQCMAYDPAGPGTHTVLGS